MLKLIYFFTVSREMSSWPVMDTEQRIVIAFPQIHQIIRPGVDIRFKHSHDLIKIGL